MLSENLSHFSLSEDSIEALSQNSEADPHQIEVDHQKVDIIFNNVCLLLTNLDPSRVEFLRRVVYPPKRVHRVVQAIWALANSSVEKSKEQCWRTAKKIINSKTINNLLHLEPSEVDHKVIIRIVDEYLDDPTWDVDRIYQGSYAAGVLAEWLNAFCGKVTYSAASTAAK